jgi:hypothetical protein
LGVALIACKAFGATPLLGMAMIFEKRKPREIFEVVSEKKCFLTTFLPVERFNCGAFLRRERTKAFLINSQEAIGRKTNDYFNIKQHSALRCDALLRESNGECV